MSSKREFDCSRDRLRIAKLSVRLSEDDVATLQNAEVEHVLPHGFFELARSGMERKHACTALLGAMRKCVGPNNGALIDLLAIVIGPEADQARQAKPKASRHGVNPPFKGLTPSGRLLRR